MITGKTALGNKWRNSNTVRETPLASAASIYCFEDSASIEERISRSVIANGYSATSVIEHITPWWATALNAAIICSAVLALLSLAMLIFTKVKTRKNA